MNYGTPENHVETLVGETHCLSIHLAKTGVLIPQLRRPRRGFSDRHIGDIDAGQRGADRGQFEGEQRKRAIAPTRPQHVLPARAGAQHLFLPLGFVPDRPPPIFSAGWRFCVAKLPSSWNFLSRSTMVVSSSVMRHSCDTGKFRRRSGGQALFEKRKSGKTSSRNHRR